jgi:hypothetical protein
MGHYGSVRRLDTHDMSFDPPETDSRHAPVSPTSLAEVVARNYAA